ncbi:hypothetical protein ABIE44_002123 [Marmoricola sp. OAE513]|uniref:hypothetical protein n=1 Tax=Marmoricola sp. OAE513 TaxID=2817894 RepID=UPI001AE707F8
MSVVRRTSVAALSAAVLVLGGCGGDDQGPASSTRATGASASSQPPGTPTGPAASADADPSAGASTSGEPTTSVGRDCSAIQGIPDGTWEGPLTMDVRGSGGGSSGTSGFADSKGAGTLRVVVARGRVTDGTWTLTWKSEGHADTGRAAASIKLTGNVRGSVKGPATKPVLRASWKVDGTVEVTKPQKYSAPVNESGEDSETMKIVSADCDEVTGTFLPSFNSKDAAATFTGTAEWKGTPAG